MSKTTLERRAFVNGLLDGIARPGPALRADHDRVGGARGRLEVCERALQGTRDHLLAVLAHDQEELPVNWREVLDRARFVGMRTADACLEVLRERSPISTEDLLSELNAGMFRFNTPFPLREIHAALMRHPHVKRDGDCWTYEPPAPKVVRPRREKEEGVLDTQMGRPAGKPSHAHRSLAFDRVAKWSKAAELPLHIRGFESPPGLRQLRARRPGVRTAGATARHGGLAHVHYK